jgi:hypothetical protein
MLKAETSFETEFATNTTVVGPEETGGLPVSMTGLEAPPPPPAATQPANDASTTKEITTQNVQLVRFIDEVSFLIFAGRRVSEYCQD